jgi:hypothetical protein
LSRTPGTPREITSDGELMMAKRSLVSIVVDDESVRESLARLAAAVWLAVKTFHRVKDSSPPTS